MEPPSRFTVGDSVQTPLGKGVVREIANSGRIAIEVNGRRVLFDETVVAHLGTARRKKERRAAPASTDSARAGARGAVEIDLHGLRVEEALARAEQALSNALLADAPELRLIHGRSGGRIRGALHRWLATIPAVRAFHLDPRNAGVTIVRL